MGQLEFLPAKEAALFDQGHLKGLSAQLGPQLAEDVLCRALEDLSIRLGVVERRYSAHDWLGLYENAEALAQSAQQVGMTLVHSVASDVMTCVDRGDHIALAATCARLTRVGEASLAAICVPHEIPF